VTEKKINILIAIESFYDGGAEMFAIRLANEIANRVNIIFLELYPYRSVSKNQKKIIESDKIKIVQVGKNYFGDFVHSIKRKGRIKSRLYSIYNWLNRKKVISVIKGYNIQIIHSHSWETDLYFSKLKSLIDFKMVSSFHGHYELLKDQQPSYFEKNVRPALNKIDKVIYLTQAHKTTLDVLNFPATRSEKVFLGINVQNKNGITTFKKGDTLKCCMIARGIPEKGWMEAIETFLELEKKYTNKIQLHLGGDSDYLKHLKNICKSEVIFFHGYQEDTMAMIKNIHVGLLPSYYKAESLPVIVIEYLFCGKPVIASKIGAIEEMLMVENKTAGILLELEDGKVSTTDFISAVEKYLDNPGLVMQHSAIALRAARKFEMQHCVSSYLKVYDNLMGQ
jgi:glycosyltransferase involved in cell wall biosynthesis